MHDTRKELQHKLVRWFRRAARPLPWRQTYNPYHIWISEVMLQQTQMERGIDYFNRWIECLPDVASVAAAEEQEILKLWEGLGYYARARNLHAAAKMLMERFDGIVPCDPLELQLLPGIGPYTSAAISSIACNTDIPVVDANVLRVYARLFDIDGPVKTGPTRVQIEKIATEMLPHGQARVFNQAIMDFGGMICLPKAPKCSNCPVEEHCLALLRGTVAERPRVENVKKTTLIEMATGLLEVEGRIFIQQRQADDIWGGLWEFPGGRIEPGESPEMAVVREYQEETGFSVDVCQKITTVTHFYTRYKVILHCFTCSLNGAINEPILTAAQDFRWVHPRNISQFGFPAGHRKMLEYISSHFPELLSDPYREL
jgi:A/G-specific adenine glycosylase